MIMNTASGMMEFEGQNNDFLGPKDTITSLWTKGLKALVPPNSFGPHKKFGTDPRTTIEIMVLLTMQKEKVEKGDPESTEMVVMGRWSR